MEVVLIRHGKTPGNLLRRYIGSTDEPLSEEGIAACREKGECSSLPQVYVTRLMRTQQTAALLFPNAKQVIVPGLEEMNFGVFENRSANDMENDADYHTWVDSFCEDACPGGERKQDFIRRVCNAFLQLIHAAYSGGENRLVLVVHGGTIMALGSLFGVPKRSYYEWGVSNLQGYRFKIEKQQEEFIFQDWELFQTLSF